MFLKVGKFLLTLSIIQEQINCGFMLPENCDCSCKYVKSMAKNWHSFLIKKQSFVEKNPKHSKLTSNL